LVHDAGLVVRGQGALLVLPGVSDITELGFDPQAAHYLGRSAGEDCFALHAGRSVVKEPWSVQGLRALHGHFDDATFAVAGRAIQIATFGVTHRFCGGCGGATVTVVGEHSVRCDACALAFYPRIAPAIIVLVRRGDHALLARAPRFPPGMYSTLAGFVEPGESLEETLIREVREEVGVEVTNVRYFGSQPWPFPHSLMVGFVADHAGGEIRVDGVEIVDAEWFLPRSLPTVPPRSSIARKLIDAWVEEVGR
jgi:NAD+ diphosphatase